MDSKPDPILSCSEVWKLFGRNAQQFLRENKNVTDDLLSENGLIGAVRDANIEVDEGEIFIIMGLSGSGKSTLLRCLARLIEPTSGQVMFEGENLLNHSENQMIQIRRHKMGMVFQHFALMPHLTVLGNVAFPLEVQGIDRSERESRALEVIELVGLQGRESYYPRELSGGQQQRVGIARSLSVEPKIWFLDEPFSALDPLIRREMQDEFLRIQSVLNKTIVFITHDFNEAVRLADRIAIMKDGAIIQIGTPEELVINPADDYVEEFTNDLSRAKVLSARTVMSEPEPDAQVGGRVSSSTKIQDLAEDLIKSELPFHVVDKDDNVIGQLTRDAVVDVLVKQP
ncbi:MAG: betaine/proline/choline family ABC transporter ATP-binding protein [Gammaproteobacteria bacterium]|nr:betaine/proline/choline family ABC transporter ATP-binding protein [Gammaproteobacteria bacterium]MYI90192.1 betaine/proline/choline family ABC transporter ATP-binding protein [Gammaproteobacteria bacterium]